MKKVVKSWEKSNNLQKTGSKFKKVVNYVKKIIICEKKCHNFWRKKL